MKRNKCGSCLVSFDSSISEAYNDFIIKNIFDSLSEQQQEELLKVDRFSDFERTYKKSQYQRL